VSPWHLLALARRCGADRGDHADRPSRPFTSGRAQKVFSCSGASLRGDPGREFDPHANGAQPRHEAQFMAVSAGHSAASGRRNALPDR